MAGPRHRRDNHGRQCRAGWFGQGALGLPIRCILGLRLVSDGVFLLAEIEHLVTTTVGEVVGGDDQMKLALVRAGVGVEHQCEVFKEKASALVHFVPGKL